MSYITSAEFVTYSKQLNADSDDLALFVILIDNAQGMIEDWTGRMFEGSSDSPTTKNFDAIEDVDGLELRFTKDLANIETVTNGDSDSTVIVSSDYVTNPRNETPYYSIKIKDSANLFWDYVNDPEDAISIRGNWSYSLTPPNAIKQAMYRLTNWLLQQRTMSADIDRPIRTAEGITIMPMQIPSDVMTILIPYKKVRAR